MSEKFQHMLLILLYKKLLTIPFAENCIECPCTSTFTVASARIISTLNFTCFVSAPKGIGTLQVIPRQHSCTVHTWPNPAAIAPLKYGHSVNKIIENVPLLPVASSYPRCLLTCSDYRKQITKRDTWTDKIKLMSKEMSESRKEWLDCSYLLKCSYVSISKDRVKICALQYTLNDIYLTSHFLLKLFVDQVLPEDIYFVIQFVRHFFRKKIVI